MGRSFSMLGAQHWTGLHDRKSPSSSPVQIVYNFESYTGTVLGISHTMAESRVP